jgi:hypothetical protein
MSKNLDQGLLCPELSATDRQLVAAYWRSRGQGEMGACLAFKQVRDDMAALGAPRSLLDVAERAVQDELKHGLWGAHFARRFGSRDLSAPVANRTKTLEFPGASVDENRILRSAMCSFTETIGCHVLADIRPRITEPELRLNNQQHLADEVIHARVCWGFLSTLNSEGGALIRRWLPVLLRAAQIACVEGPEQDEFEHLVPYGYFTPRVLRASYQRALTEVIEPGLLHLRITEAA